MIVQEEMRRVLEYHRWKAGWWRDRSSLRDRDDAKIVSGISGYAHKQAAVCLRMAEQCALYWLPVLNDKGLVPSWASDYEHLLRKVQKSQAVAPLEVGEPEDITLDLEGLEGDIDSEGDEEDTEEVEDFDFGD